MHNAAISIEAFGHHVIKTCVFVLEPAKNRVRHQIGELNKSGGLRVDENRHFSVVSGPPKRVTRRLEFLCERLDPLFCRTLIEQDKTALRVALLMESAEKLIEAAAQLFKCNLSDVLTSEVFLFENGCKQTNFIRVALTYSDCQGIDNCLFAVQLRKVSPFAFTRSHGTSMKLDGLRIVWVKTPGNLLQFLIQPMRLALGN